MKEILKNITLILFSFLFLSNLSAQDSLQKSLEKRLVELANQRKNDSLKRVELENKLTG